MNEIEIIYDFHTIEYFVKNKINFIIKIYIIKKNKKINNLIINKIKKYNIPVYLVTKKIIFNMSKNKKYNMCIFVKKKMNFYYNKNIIINKIINNKERIFLILENITNSGNLGSCIRNADAFGIKTVFITKNNTCDLNDNVIKSSSGALNNIDIIRTSNIYYILKIMKNYNVNIIGTSNKSYDTIYNFNFIYPLVLIFGSESVGIKKKTFKYCNNIIKIPMLGYINSINVSTSVGIFLFECLRQNIIN